MSGKMIFDICSSRDDHAFRWGNPCLLKVNSEARASPLKVPFHVLKMFLRSLIIPEKVHVCQLKLIMSTYIGRGGGYDIYRMYCPLGLWCFSPLLCVVCSQLKILATVE